MNSDCFWRIETDSDIVLIFFHVETNYTRVYLLYEHCSCVDVRKVYSFSSRKRVVTWQQEIGRYRLHAVSDTMRQTLTQLLVFTESRRSAWRPLLPFVNEGTARNIALQYDWNNMDHTRICQCYSAGSTMFTNKLS